MPQRVDVENAFADFVRSHGGEVVEDTFGTSLQTPNADYYFRGEGVIGELKRLVENQDESESLKARIQSRFDRWMSDGTIGVMYGRNAIQSHTLPEKCQRELIDLYRPNLRKRILKANKQIKETAKLLGLKQAKGILLIANDGNYALEADAALYLIGRILGTSCSSINSVIYFTVNMYASSPATPFPTLVWVHATRKNVLAPVSDGFVAGLFNGWHAYLQVLRNERIEKVSHVSSHIDQVRYLHT